MIQIFHRGEVVPIWCEVKNWLGVYINPSQGAKVTIYKPDGTIKVEDAAMDPVADGIYVYYYYSAIADPDDWWRYICVPTDGTGGTTKKVFVNGSFKLI
jgi:hypothetical protein